VTLGTLGVVRQRVEDLRRVEEPRQLARALMAVFVATFLIGIPALLLGADLLLAPAAMLGAAPQVHVFLAATVGLLVLLALLSYRVARDPVGERDLLPLLAASKVGSSAAAAYLAIAFAEPGVMVVALTDLPMGGIAAWLHRTLEP
jgi:hypothetical protein